MYEEPQEAQCGPAQGHEGPAEGMAGGIGMGGPGDVVMEVEDDDMMEQPLDDQGDGSKMGTLSGVFFPCLQNIFGIILFLRLPWMVGQAGFLLAFIVVGCSCLTTFSTCLSMSAIATNGQVRAGGTYFLISRTLGPEFGGSVGLSFYLGTTIAGAMYVLGAVETAQVGFGLKWDIFFLTQIQGTILCVLTVVVVMIGVKLVAMIAPVFLFAVIIGISLMWIGLFSSFGVGKSPGIVNMWSDSQLGNNFGAGFDEGWNLNKMFGLFFPSCTGIMAGANRSVVLKNPSYSIPVGTCAAILITSTVYLMCVLWFAMGATREKLKNLDSLIVGDVAFPHPAVVQVAVFLSTVGAGMQSLTGAPRLLQAIVADDIMPILGFLSEPADRNPRKTLFVTWFIANACILTGNIDIVSPIVTMFFLLFYLFTNMACLLLTVLKAPNFRPTFRFYNWATALIGATLCLTIMIVINPLAALGAVIFACVVYKYILTRGKKKDWGDGFVGVRMQNARQSLLRINGLGPLHYKNWRPCVLLLTKVQTEPLQITEPDMLAFVRHLKHGSGLSIIGTVINDHYAEGGMPIVDKKELVANKVREEQCDAFVEVVADTDVTRGFSALIQVAGIGRYQPNIVILGFPRRWEEKNQSVVAFLSALKMCEKYMKGIMVYGAPTEGPKYPTELETQVGCFGTSAAAPATPPRIDIWWRPHGGGLLILVPHLLKKHISWRGAICRVYSLYDTEEEKEPLQKKVQELFHGLRFEAELIMVHFQSVGHQAYSYPRTVMMREGKELSKQVTESASKYDQDRAEGAKQRLDDASKIITKKPNPDEGLDLDKARQLNQLIMEKSMGTNFILLNLPKYTASSAEDDMQFLNYTSTLTHGLPPHLLVRDSGREVSTSVF